MQTIRFGSWNEFRDICSRYSALSRERKAQWIFRGQPRSDWLLETTLDREQTFASSEVRDARVSELLDEFRREAIRLDLPWAHLPNSEGFELLARHHGLPSPLTDWTESIYISAFFAFDGCRKLKSERVAVYGIDRTLIRTDSGAFDLIDDIELLRFNKRAWQQRGIFVRLSVAGASLEEVLGDALFKFDLPADAAPLALAELDEMTINRTYLFADGEAAASTAAERVFGQGALS